jgi:anti-anti-sigma factor
MFTAGVKVRDGIGTVTLEGDLDHQTADRLRRVVLTALSDGAASLVLDCEQLAFIDSSGLGVLIEAHKAADAQGGSVTIRHASPQMLRLLDVTGLNGMLTIDSDSEPDSQH